MINAEAKDAGYYKGNVEGGTVRVSEVINAEVKNEGQLSGWADVTAVRTLQEAILKLKQ